MMNIQLLIGIFLLSYLIGKTTQTEASDKRCTKNSTEHLLLEDGQSRLYTKIMCDYGHRDTLDFFFTGDIGGKQKKILW